MIGGISNVIQHHSDIVDGNPWEVFRDWNIYYNIGNVAGSTGAAVETLIGNKGGYISNAIASGLNGFFEGLINETCNSVYEGNSFGEALSSGYHEGFYRMGGKIATSLVSQDYTIPLGKIFGVNAYTSFNLTASSRNIQNHMVRSLAYHIGGNIFTGKAPFKGFNKDFVGINVSMIIPALIDGFTYYANRSGLSDRLLAKQTSSIHDSYAKYMEAAETNEIKYEIKGPINARFFFDSDGYFKVSGFIHVLDNYSDFLGPQNITFVALWVSKINFSFLNSFIIK